MIDLMKKAHVLGAIACVLMSSGCVMLERTYAVKKVESFPQVDRRPLVRISEMNTENYLNGKKSGVPRFNNKKDLDLLQTRFERSHLFRDAAIADQRSDFTLKFDDRMDMSMSGVARFFSLATLMVIPFSDDRTYSLTAHITENKTGLGSKVEVSEPATCIRHWICLPFNLIRSCENVESGIKVDLMDNLAIAVHSEILKMSKGGDVQAVEGAGPVATRKVSTDSENDGLVKKLKALKDAREADVLTEQEYQTKRAEVLKGL